jgi:hypothetical protein
LLAKLCYHLLTWWGIRVLSAGFAYQVAFAGTPMQAAEWWAVRLLRAVAMLAIVAVWVHRRELSWQALGLGKPRFWRAFMLSVGGMAALWVVMSSAYHVWPRDPTGIGLRAISALVCFVDVLAQQLSTFGLLQGVLAPCRGQLLPFGLAWLSFGVATHHHAAPHGGDLLHSRCRVWSPDVADEEPRRGE